MTVNFTNKSKAQARSTAVLSALLCLLGVASLFIGVYEVEPARVLALDAQALHILLISRLPRLMSLICTGVGMAVAGLIMQQLFQNRFVSPTTGTTLQAAQFGILLTLLFFPQSGVVTRSLLAFACAVLSTWIFAAFVQKVRYKDSVMVPLIGIMMGSIIMGITNFMAFKYDLTQALSSWSVGHFSGVIRGRYELVYLVLPLIVIAFIYANLFNIVGFGREFSANLGVNYNLYLVAGLTVAAMLTAAVVSVVGAVSYIGLIVPNLVAIFKGDNLRRTLPDTALAGACFVLLCDIIGRIIIYPYELPIELIIGIVGTVIFIALIFYRLNGGLTFRLKKPRQERPADGGMSHA